ncbi:hypothetical protein QUF76_08145 [Desulfobacterales bacterium HSG16]|nr:hypothetical protein [Desulfobacterales bacterium HSG16]
MMECIDAIEANLKRVLERLYKLFAENGTDDSEYIRNVKAVLEGTAIFLNENRDFFKNVDALNSNLYDFSKSLWLNHIKTVLSKEDTADKKETALEDKGYHSYYYDYIFNHDIYPR